MGAEEWNQGPWTPTTAITGYGTVNRPQEIAAQKNESYK